MSSALTLMTPALLAGVLFSGMHVYAGLRLIDRGAILAALAITQFAALGASASVLTGHELQSVATYGWSFASAAAVAVALSFIRRQRDIAAAIAYISAVAGTIVVLTFAPQAPDHIRVMFAGDIAGISRHTLLLVGAMYVCSAVFLWRYQSDLPVYAATAWIVAFSVPLGGVLLAAAYLIMPAAGATLFSRSIGTRLAIGWTMGALVTALGILLSLQIDLPTGATIVCTFGLTLVLMAAVWAMTRRGRTA